MRNSRTAQDPTSRPSEASDAAEAILGPMRGMRPSAPTPSGRRRLSNHRRPTPPALRRAPAPFGLRPLGAGGEPRARPPSKTDVVGGRPPGSPLPGWGSRGCGHPLTRVLRSGDPLPPRFARCLGAALSRPRRRNGRPSRAGGLPRGRSDSPGIGGPTPPIPRPRPGALPRGRPRHARGIAPNRGPYPEDTRGRGALPPQRNCGEVSPPDLGTGGPTPSGQKNEGALPLSDPPPPSDPQPNSPHRGALAKPPATPGSPPRMGTAPGHRRSLRPSELGKSGCGLASRPGACGADAPASFSRRSAQSAALLAGDRVSPLRFLTLFPLRASPLPLRGRPLPCKERFVRHLPGETFRRKHGRNRGCAPPLGGSPTRSPVGFRPTGPRHKDGAPYPPPGHGRPSRGCGRRPVAGSLPAHRLPVLALGLPALGDRPTASGPGPCRGRLVALRTSPPAAPPTRHGEIVGPFADLRSAPPLQSETLRWPIAAGGLPFGNALFPLRSLL